MSDPTDPTDLTVPPFERVSHIDFDEPTTPLKVVRFRRLTPAEEAEDDW